MRQNKCDILEHSYSRKSHSLSMLIHLYGYFSTEELFSAVESIVLDFVPHAS